MSDYSIYKNFKPYVFPVLALVILDQAAKLLIVKYFPYYDVVMIGNSLSFRPVQNTNFTYGGNYIGILSNKWVAITFNIVVILLFISGYLLYKHKKTFTSMGVKIIVACGLAGSICSFIDKSLWGGGLDFIQIHGRFTFDLKDCYLTIAEVIFLIVALRHNREISIKEYILFCCGKNKQ